MPIVVQCGSCSVRLSVPDRAAGKNLKCPKCQTPITVPDAADAEGFDIVEDMPPTTARAKPIATRVVRDAIPVEDDELPVNRKSARYEDDDRPLKKKQPPKMKSKMALILLGVIVVLFVGCGGILALGYKLMQDTQELAKNGGLGPQPNGAVAPVNTPIAKNNPIATVPAPKLPAGWEKFNDPLGEINLYFPGGQPEKNEALSAATSQKMRGLAADTWIKTVGDNTYVLSRTDTPRSDPNTSSLS